MYPILLEFGIFKIFSYGLLVALGFLAAILLASSRAEEEGMEPQKIFDLCFYVMLSALLGARLLYVIVEYKYFLSAPLEIFKFWKGGLVFYGGLILGGIISPMNGIGPDDLNIRSLIAKVNSGKILEVILALTTSLEGDTTNFYLYKKLKESNVKLTAIARGVSIGDELEYVDDITLGRSILDRTPYKATIAQ